MSIAILDSCAEDRARIREAVSGVVDGPFVEIDTSMPVPDESLAGIRLALLETDLPGDSGVDLLKRLRATQPDVPVVVVTRRVEPDRIVAAMKAGACDHLGKDRLDRLPDAVREALAEPPTGGNLRAALRQARAIGHDLRNVFQSIRLATDLLRRITDEGRRVPLLDTLLAGISRGRDLLAQMMLVARVDDPRASSPGKAILPVGPSGVILIIDDEPNICHLARLVVEGRGYRTLTASDGADALDKFQKHQHEIAAVVVDLMMPPSGGVAVIRTLREKVPALPILPTSGLPAARELLNGLSLRVFLPKPFTASQLIEALERLLAQEDSTWPAS